MRFPDVLRHRVETLKCNQDRYVVEDIVEFGAPFRFGLEAGSKPELLLAMGCLAARGNPDALLICNGRESVWLGEGKEEREADLDATC